MEGLIQEVNRNKELLKQYEAIGQPGIFGAAMIKRDIEQAEKVMGQGDTIEMLKSYEQLKLNKG